MKIFGDQRKAIGSEMFRYFKINRPSVDLSFRSIIYKTNLVFVLQVRDDSSDSNLQVN